MLRGIVKTIAILAMTFFFLFNAEAADSGYDFGKDDEWLVYMYICGTNLEEKYRDVTGNIAEMQKVKLPSNIKILINASGTKEWHHPEIKKDGNGIYLYSSNSLKKMAHWNADMGDPRTLREFLKYGEKHFDPDHRILIFWDHGGVNGLCYDDAFDPGHRSNLTYDDLTKVFSTVYGKSKKIRPLNL